VTRERRIFAVVPAAGRGERYTAANPNDPPKQYAPLLGATVLDWALRPLLGDARIEVIVVALAAADTRGPAHIAALDDPRLCTAIGGNSRQASVLRGLARLEAVAQAKDWVLVHDAARPCLLLEDVRTLLDALNEDICGALLAVPVVDTVKRGRAGLAAETVDRSGLWRALTPQVFRFGELKAALEDAEGRGETATDEAQAMERLGLQPLLVEGSQFNIKVTRAQDLATAAGILSAANSGERLGNMPGKIRVGQGIDVHAFGEGDHVVLGGVRIPYSRGVIAHSDGDVVIHALCDAVLGALGEGDIGRHFPDSDPRYRGADSRVFLRTVAGMMHAVGLRLVNADITVLAEAPRIAAHRAAIEANLAADLGVAAGSVNVKATTTEKLGFIGRSEGLAALASVLLCS
jgi:2-C-methyl-D-erythritol 4-phosphate cytidylyltransferase / 2-C-methyl-D-erythritol 2,4-cyclodiphosphate synthase